MLSHLIRKEFLDSLLNQRFLTLAIFSIVLMPLSAFINYRYYEARKASFDSQFGAFSDDEAAAPMRAYRGPVILSALARGTEPYMPVFYEYSSVVNGEDQDPTSPGNIEAQDFTMLSTFGNFDLLFIVQIVFSLLAILLSFDMIAGEKERGTLKAVLANRVPRDNIILGKFIGGFAVLWITFVIGFLLLYLVLAVLNGQFLDAAVLPRVALIFGCATLFIAGFFTLGLMVSAFCHSTRTAIVALLVIWVALQLVVPKAGELIAQVMVPIRSEHELRMERSRIIEEEREAMAIEAGKIFLRLTDDPSSIGVDRDAPWFDQFKVQYQDLFRNSKKQRNDRLRNATSAWERERDAQQRLGSVIALLSPASALSFLISDAAGTGNLAYRYYKTAVAEQYQVVDREVFSKIEDSSYRIKVGNSTSASSFGYESPDPGSIPHFVVSPQSISEVMRSNIWSFIVLCFYIAVSLLISYVKFLRYDVR